MMITAINSATTFKAVYYTNDKFSKKQEQICNDIEEKIKQSKIANKYNYVIEPADGDSVLIYNTPIKKNNSGDIVSFGPETYFKTIDENNPFDIKQLEDLHKRHSNLLIGLAVIVGVTMTALFAILAKATRFNNSNTQTECVNKINTFSKDTLDLTKRFVK